MKSYGEDKGSGIRVCLPVELMNNMLNDHLASAPQSERARLNETLYHVLDDYISLLRLRHELRRSRPHWPARKFEEVLKTENRFAWWPGIIDGHRDDVLKFDLQHKIRDTIRAFENTAAPGGGCD